MVRVGEDQEILSLEPCHVRSWNGRQCSRSITRTSQSITTEPSHRFTGAYQSLFLRLFWLGIDHPWTRPKPPINAFKWSPQGITPIYSRSAFYDYSCRCLLCSDTPVTDLINFALASPSLPPTKRTEINYLKQLRTKEGFILKPRAVIMDLQHEDLSWILCRALTHITFVINSARN